MPRPGTSQLNLCPDPGLIEELDKFAKQMGTSRNRAINQLLWAGVRGAQIEIKFVMTPEELRAFIRETINESDK